MKNLEFKKILSEIPDYFLVEDTNQTVKEFSAVFDMLPDDYELSPKCDNIHIVHSYPDDREYISFKKM